MKTSDISSSTSDIGACIGLGRDVLDTPFVPFVPRSPFAIGTNSGIGVVGTLPTAPFLTNPSIDDSNAPENLTPPATCPLTPFIAIAEPSLNPPRLLTSRAPVDPCRVVSLLCSPEKSVNVRTLVGVAGRDCGCWRRLRSEERGLGLAMGGRLVGEGLRFGGWE